VNSVDRKVLSHPMRVRILTTLAVAPANAAELGRDLSQPIGKIAYHLFVLVRADYIEPAFGEEPDAPDPRYESLRI
jgi:DNA-binding transcriptional ArsR family regulator